MTRSALRHRLTSGRWNEMQPGVYAIAGTPASWRQQLNAAVLQRGQLPRPRIGRRRPYTASRASSMDCRTTSHGAIRGGERTLSTCSRASTCRIITRIEFMGSPSLPWRAPCSTSPATCIRRASNAHSTTHLRAVGSQSRRVGEYSSNSRSTVASGQYECGHCSKHEVAAPLSPRACLSGACFRSCKSTASPHRRVRSTSVIATGGWGHVELVYRDVSLLVEADSRRHHSSFLDQTADRRHDNQFMAEGFRVLRFTWDDITTRPAWVAETVRRAREVVLHHLSAS